STDFVNYAINPELSLDLSVKYGDGVAIFTAEGQGGGEDYTYDWDLDNNGTYEMLDGGQEQRIYGYDQQGTVNARVTDACLNEVEESIQYNIPEEVIVDPPTLVIAKGIFELDGVTPHDGSSSYLVMWYPDNMADSYTIQESHTEDFAIITNEFITVGTRKKFTNMPDGTYYYRVMGCNDAGCTAWSDTMAAIVGVLIDAPNTPTNLTATTLSESSILLDWNDISDNEEGFKLYRNGAEIADIPADSVSYVDTGLACSTSYTYILRAYNASGLSPVSNMATGTTEDCEVMPTPPVSPTGVSAIGISQTEVEISWTDASSDETGFRIFRDGTQIADIPTNMTSYTDTGLECGTVHSYYVLSYNNYGQSAPSSTADATTQECQQTTTTPPASENYVQATLHSPAYLHALDALGRHIGRIGEDSVEIAIPGGIYSGLDSEPQVITIYNPQSEVQFYFEAYEEGTVTLDVEASENGQTETYTFKDLNVQNGTVFLVNAGAASGQLDLDGDGEYEQSISGIMVVEEEEESKTMMYVALVAVIVLIALAAVYLTRKRE
ncbi:MAG: fibronectin type III domain-containing protein, partial [Candidatus Methanofastidiosa archaeon]|nr:fibronectin type III domain-containing protein [Candidatus Methanofastidiosa archaeon]